VVDAVVVVEAQVGVELAFQAAQARLHVAGEGRTPALVEDRLVQRLDVAVGLRAPGMDAGVLGAQALHCRGELALELVAVVREEALQAPACGLEVSRYPASQLGCLLRARIALLGDHQLRPAEGRGDVDRGELPDLALGAPQAADVEAVDPDQLAGPGDVDVALWARIARWLIGSGVTGNQPQALGAGVEAVAAEHLPDAVGGDDDRAPLVACQLCGDALGPEAGVGDREAEDPLLDHLRQLVGHLGATALPGAQHLQAMAVDRSLPGVVGRAVNPEASAGHRDAGPGGLGEEGLAVAEQHVILGHATPFLNFIGVKPGA